MGHRLSGVRAGLLVVGLALVLLSACSSAAAPAATAIPAAAATSASGGTTAPSAIKGDPAAGKTLFEANCVGCHGANAAGGQKIGDATSADIRGPALDQAFKGDQSAIEQAILNGKGPGRELNPAMPRWQDKLTTEQVDNIIAYLYTQK